MGDSSRKAVTTVNGDGFREKCRERICVVIKVQANDILGTPGNILFSTRRAGSGQFMEPLFFGGVLRPDPAASTR